MEAWRVPFAAIEGVYWPKRFSVVITVVIYLHYLKDSDTWYKTRET